MRKPRDPDACRSCRQYYPPNEHAAYGSRCEDCYAAEQKDRRTPCWWAAIMDRWSVASAGGGVRIFRKPVK
jgi:hypothetical protein